MIHRVFSTLPTFKTVDLRGGLNILLCDKSPGATEKQTRNRAGKSSFVEVIHFVLGANCDSDSVFRAPELVASSFGLEFDLYGERVKVSRTASEPSKIVIQAGETRRWLLQPKLEKDHRRVISNTAWRTVLGHAMFGIGQETDKDPDESAGHPTFRSLFSYFARRENNGGMRDPTRNSAMQQIGDSQIALSYLIGLDWTVAQQWEAVRQKEKQIRELKRIVSQGGLVDVLESSASLRSRLVVAEEKLRRIVNTLSSFRVHDQYHDLENEASANTRALSDLADENSVDRTYLEELEVSMRSETPPAPTDLTHLYEEAGVVLPDLVRRRYEDVLTFHKSVVRNRRSYLESERNAASERIKDRDLRKASLDRRRSELMTMLKSHGALDHFVALQAEHGRNQAEVETLRRRYEAATQLESTSTALEADRVRLMARLRQEFDERSAVLSEAITAFSDIVEELYGEPGQLEFHATHNGPELRIAIQGDRSRGIGNMELFCFDMMLQRMCRRRGIGTGFLMHDSHLFDGVDSRQIGRALAIGARLAEESESQYLVTLNSDMLVELPAGFKAQDHIVPARLTDATINGGLFGIRFEPPRGEQPDVSEETDTRPKRRSR